MVRHQPADVAGFSRAYATATGDRRVLPAFAFGDSADLADKLARLVTHGPKRATASLLADLEHDGDDVPRPGERWVVLDGAGDAACVIETLEVRLGALDSVDPAFAWDEGEGDRTREDWLEQHRRFFARRLAALGRDPCADHVVVFERFDVTWPLPEPDRPIATCGEVDVRPLAWDEQVWAAGVLARGSGTSTGTGCGRGALPGLVAAVAGERVGLATFRPRPGREAEVVSVDALRPGRGIGRLLLDALATVGRGEGWSRLWCVTASGGAVRLCQHAGWDLAARRTTGRADADGRSVPDPELVLEFRLGDGLGR